jgi:ferric-dicitrate binding protein FerR (iron transport regulator)
MTKDQFIKYLQGHCTEKEFEEILDWIKEGSTSASGKGMVEELWNEFEPVGGQVESIKYKKILNNIHHQIDLKDRSRLVMGSTVKTSSRLLTILTRVAAILLLPVLSLLLYTTFKEKGSYAENSVVLEVEAPAGSRMNFTLGDGTKVWLNHGSKLKYPYQFDDIKRKVFLTGEAYFVVAHNDKVPFIVETSHIDVKATGTEFNVSAYDDDDMVVTTLVEGKVIVNEKENEGKTKEMFPNQILKYTTGPKKSILESGNTDKYVAWRNGLLIFKNDPIEDIAKKLAKWYNVEVEITNEKAKEYTCTATFTDETLAQVLELISMPTPVKFNLLPREKEQDGTFAKQKVSIGLKEKQL